MQGAKLSAKPKVYVHDGEAKSGCEVHTDHRPHTRRRLLELRHLAGHEETRDSESEKRRGIMSGRDGEDARQFRIPWRSMIKQETTRRDVSKNSGLSRLV